MKEVLMVLLALVLLTIPACFVFFPEEAEKWNDRSPVIGYDTAGGLI